MIEFQEVFRGTIDGASVHPREIVKLALQRNSAAVIVAHNHPSGIAEPSQADELITQRVKEALALVDIRLLDHIIVGDGVSVSLAERGAQVVEIYDLIERPGHGCRRVPRRCVNFHCLALSTLV